MRGILMAFLAWAASLAAAPPVAAEPLAYTDQALARAEARVGGTFWTAPRPFPFQPEFFETADLSVPFGVDAKARFTVEALVADGPFYDPRPVYRLRFDSGRVGHISVAIFEAQTWRAPGLHTTIGLSVPAGQSPEGYLFERRWIFDEDPDIIAARLHNKGPTTVRVGPPAGTRR